MNVLFLPINTASQPGITALSLNKLDGVNAICMTTVLDKYFDTNECVLYIKGNTSSKNPIKWIVTKINYWRKVKKLIDWADVLHYTWDSALLNDFDLKWAKRSGKTIFIEWLGSDIRDLAVFEKYNEFSNLFFVGKTPKEILETSVSSFRNQSKFLKYNAIPVLCPEMSIYLNRLIFTDGAKLLMQRMNTTDFQCHFPLATRGKLLIVHSPSNKSIKGTEYILPAIEELSKDFDFEFRLLHNVSRAEALKSVSECDIFIDQILIGSYGSAAMEAMSYGKPVMCYIMPEVFQSGLPSECPIVNSNPTNIKDQLKILIKNGNLRNEIGKKSRAYMEKYHDADTIAPKLLQMYKKVLAK
jgi:glycosyltransferase involved in cell wall biosynthesis